MRAEIAELTEWVKDYDELAQAGKGAGPVATSGTENASNGDGVDPDAADDTEAAAAPVAT